jgi:hypothetical protein
MRYYEINKLLNFINCHYTHSPVRPTESISTVSATVGIEVV